MSPPSKIEIQEFSLWEKKQKKSRALYSFNLELTARCNLNCRHCFINLPASDQVAKASELTFSEIEKIAEQAVELGAVWVLLTGGEPLLRPDFAEIYMMLKRKGLLISVFTNATLIQPEHITLFKNYPPRDIEVTIYGSSPEVYEKVTQKPGSFNAFERGLESLFNAGVRVRLKAMGLRSNLSDLQKIADYGRKYTKDYYRFDPILHLRYDQDEQRNEDIRSERLTPGEISKLEQSDLERFESMKRNCNFFLNANKSQLENRLFTCLTGHGNFTIGYDGTFRLCPSLWAPGTTVNLREVKLRKAWEEFVPAVREMHTTNQEYLNACGICPIVNICMNCPAHAYLETGKMDVVVPYFCEVAHARAAALQKAMGDDN